jgi:hypothetical protein
MTILFEVLKGVLLIINGKSRSGMACFKGILSFVFNLNQIYPKRVIVQKKRKVNDSVISHLMIPPNASLAQLLKNVDNLRQEWG